MRALIINCTLKPSPSDSNTAALANVVEQALRDRGVDVDTVRAVDHRILPGVEDDMGNGDQWPDIREKVLASDILVMATPTWLGQHSSVAQRVLERLDALISQTDDHGTYVAYNKVAGVVVTGNEDGAHHVISQIAGGLIDIGFTVPGQAWTYWNMGPGPGPSYTETDHRHEWSASTGRQAAANLVAVAAALQGRVMDVVDKE